MKVLKGNELATYKGLNNKTVIQTWRTKEFHKKIQKINIEMKLKNPQLEFLLYNNDEMDNSVEENFDRDIVKTYFKFLHYVPRADFWRYLMVEKFGCIYLDIDSMIIANINELLKSKKLILFTKPMMIFLLTCVSPYYIRTNIYDLSISNVFPFLYVVVNHLSFYLTFNLGVFLLMKNTKIYEKYLNN